MIRNISEISSSSPYDICIIGTGPAGITLCNELAGSGLRICILESGDKHKTSHADQLRVVESEGIVIKDNSRERVIGGASTTWSGISAPLDPIDMSHRSFLKVPGWPISRSELEPYWEKASQKYRFPSLDLIRDFAEGHKHKSSVPSWGKLREKIFLSPLKYQRFGEEYMELFNHPGVDLFCNTTAPRLEGSVRGNDKFIERVIAVSDTKKEYSIQARNFILATGGIENARLLMSSKNLCSAGLGNEHDQVGRYFMNHPKGIYGYISLKKGVDGQSFLSENKIGEYRGYVGLRLDESIQNELGLMNSYVRLEPVHSWTGISGRLNRLTRLPDLVRYLWVRFILKQIPPVRRLRIRNFMEMEPDPDNRITLSSSKDIYGHYMSFVTHRSTTRDRRSLVELHRAIREELEVKGLGWLEGDLASETNWPIDQDASHHMGSTRMGDDPGTSVVDRNLRVHTVGNVYCAGSSVFPTSGCANPTFTICALSIRLAEHLKSLQTS